MPEQTRTNTAAASQRGRTPPAESLSAPPPSSPPNIRSQRNSLLDSIDKLVSLPALLCLPSDNPLRSFLSPFLAEARAYLTASASTPLPIESRLDNLQSLVSSIDKKLSPGRPSYAQAASTGAAPSPPARAPASEPSRIGNQILVKISPEDAHSLKPFSPEQIIKRLQGGSSEIPEAPGIIAAKKLSNGNIILHAKDASGKALLESNTNWTNRIAPSAAVHVRSFPVLIHGVSTAGRNGPNLDSLARIIEADNSNLHPGLHIKRVRWLRRPSQDKTHSSLVADVACAPHANRMITEGVILQYELKVVELHDYRSRIIQCFKCQSYDGHTSTTCKNPEKCGNCGLNHKTQSCNTESQISRRRCAACTGQNHASWSSSCPARAKEAERAALFKSRQPYLYPAPALSALTPSSASSRSSQSGGARLFEPSIPPEWTLVEGGKKRRIARPIGRPPKASTIDINFGSMLSFVSQGERTENAGMPPSTQDTDMNSAMTEASASQTEEL